jgi:regulator of cell morphogenesis and NO signaling
MITNPITPETTVGEIVRAAPSRSHIFERLGIDYCCGGKKPLQEACGTKGLEVASVIALLSAVESDGLAAMPTSPSVLSLSALCDHIEQVHHEYLRQELPRLDFMTRKVAVVHGDHEPRLLEVREIFQQFSTAIAAHTQEEENRIFPAIRSLEMQGGGPSKVAQLKADLEKLESEHDRAGAALARFHELTDGFTPPEWACNTFRALYDGLAKLENDTHEHVHEENNILFPRALAASGAA